MADRAGASITWRPDSFLASTTQLGEERHCKSEAREILRYVGGQISAVHIFKAR